MKLRRYLYLFIVSLFCIGVCWAQQAAPAPKKVVIRAGRMLDVKTGRLLAQQEIVIEGDKIKAVRPYDPSPSGEQFIDLSSATVLPGLIDAHTHITMTTNFGYSRLAISVPREALNGARNARVTLDAGFTTIRNVGASGFTDVALRDAINAGQADTATTICCRLNLTCRAWVLPMASKPSSTKRGRSSSTAPT